MAYKPTRMDQIQKIIEYYNQGFAKKRIARLLGISKNTVKEYLKRVEDRKIELSQIDHPETIKALYRPNNPKEDPRDIDIKKRIPELLKELGRVGVTRYLLWEEYIEEYPTGFSYSRFCRKLKDHISVQNATLRLEHKAAYRLTVDFTGKKVSWVEKKSGLVHDCEVLVCTLPFSGYTFAYAVESQRQEDFIEGLNRCFLFIGGLPKVLLSDNLKSYVKKANRYEPTFSELCIQLSSYYGVELEAARVAKPKDKAHVERHVAIVYNRLFAPIRDKVFHSLIEINLAFVKELHGLNSKNYQGKDYSRKSLFEKDEKPHLKALPQSLFEVKNSVNAKVQKNYHVILGQDKHQYSVPYHFIGKTAQVIYTSQTVEVYLGIERIAIHKRDRRKYGYTTLPIHMPEKHKKYLEQRGWDAAYFKNQAIKIGPDTLWAIEHILESKGIIEQTYNSCLGVLRLAKIYGNIRLEKASTRAKSAFHTSYGILNNILKNNMDMLPLNEETTLFNTPEHENIRGSDHYT